MLARPRLVCAVAHICLSSQLSSLSRLSTPLSRLGMTSRPFSTSPSPASRLAVPSSIPTGEPSCLFVLSLLSFAGVRVVSVGVYPLPARNGAVSRQTLSERQGHQEPSHCVSQQRIAPTIISRVRIPFSLEPIVLMTMCRSLALQSTRHPCQTLGLPLVCFPQQFVRVDIPST